MKIVNCGGAPHSRAARHSLKIKIIKILLAIIILLPHGASALNQIASDLAISQLSESIKIGPFGLLRVFSLAEILTGFSISLSAIVFVLGWYRNQRLKREEYAKEYADKIRNSASIIVAKLDRWRELNLKIIFDIEPIIETTDSCLVEEQDITKARCLLWMGLIRARAITIQNIVDEQIEIAYKDLHGYTPDIESFCIDTINKIKYIDRRIYQTLLKFTEMDIFEMELLAQENIIEKPFKRDYLGNRLRITVGMIRFEYDDLMWGAIEPFREQMIELIRTTDKKIYKKEISKMWKTGGALCKDKTININESKLHEKIKNMDDNKMNKKMKREFAQYWALKGLNFCYLEDYAKAFLCYCKAIELDPSIPGFWAGKGLTLRARRSETEAEKSFKRAIELIPGGPELPFLYEK